MEPGSSGRKQIITLAAILGIAIVTAIPLAIGISQVGNRGNSEDPELREAVQAELANRQGANTSAALDEVDMDDPDAAIALAELTDPEGIEIHSLRISRPLLSFSSSEDVIVLVGYTLPGQPRQEEYWRFTHSLVGGWRYRRESSATSFYLNFM
jgi:hypothetical protein